jgi:predicted unusual protein kinase regulating ubiquinone biosynthesis (AarF/ABC1/UbiB family)
MQVLISYLTLPLLRRFRSKESGAGFTQTLHQRNARRILAAAEDLQGLFIKVGQLISVMANLLPDAFRKELETLQDSVPPRPFDAMKSRLCEELGGRSTEEVFAEFDPHPVASASIGQVHKARLHTGERVAVKIQYPGIEAIVALDLGALRRIFAVLGRMLPDWGWSVIYSEIREMVLSELDYRQEAEAMRIVAANFVAQKTVRIPKVIGDLCTSRILVTEWIDGSKVSDLPAITAAGIDRTAAARRCIEAYCKQIFDDGIYHADPHPGNLLLIPETNPGEGPTVVFLDFGATARISPGMRKGIVSFLQGAITRDVSRIVSAMKEMGFISRHADHQVFDRVIEHFYDRLRSQMRFQQFSTGNLSAGLDLRGQIATLFDLRELNVSLADLRDAFHVPKEWVLLERTLLLLLGVCTTLDPALNPALVIQPYVDRFLLGERKEWSETVMETAREAALSAFALPSELGRYLTLATRGDLEIRIRRWDEMGEVFYALGQQFLWGFLASVGLGLSVVFADRGQYFEEAVARTGSALCGMLLLLALLRGRRMRKRRR